MKKTVLTLAIAAALAVGMMAPALAAAWTANPGASYDPATGTITLDNSDPTVSPAGTSYETADLGAAISTGDQISFDFTGLCAAGSPRMFIEVDGTYYNTFDDPATTGCGVLDQGTTSGTAVYTYTGPDGTIGHAGLVHDSAPGVVTISNLTIGGDGVLAGAPQPQDECKKGGWRGEFKNQGACVSSKARTK